MVAPEGNGAVLALLTLFTLDCSCLVPVLPGTAASHPKYHRYCVALLFLLPTAQVSLSGRVEHPAFNRLPHRQVAQSTVSMRKGSDITHSTLRRLQGLV